MGKQEEIFRRCEKLSKAAKLENQEKPARNPGSCKRCIYFRPDFRYRRCQFSRCPYGNQQDMFRKKPLKRDRFS